MSRAGLFLSSPTASARTTWPKQPSPRGFPSVNLRVAATADIHSHSAFCTLLALRWETESCSAVATCRAAAPKMDRREARTRTLLSGRWWLHWVDETGESNTPQTEGRRRIQLTPTDRERLNELVFLYGSLQTIIWSFPTSTTRAVTCLFRGMLLANFWTAIWLLKSLFFGAQQSRQMTAVAVRTITIKKPRQ